MYSTTRRNYQLFLGALLILSLVLAFFPAGVAHATTVTPGYVAPDEDLIGVRFRSFGNTGGDEIYVGVPNLGDQPRAQTNIVWASGTNAITIVYDQTSGSLTATVVNSNGTYTLARTNAELLADLTAKGKTYTLADLNIMQITVASRDTGASVAFNNVELDGDSLGDFNLSGFNDWMVEGAQLDDGFTLTGDIVLTGSFGDSQELSRVEVKVGHNAPPPPPIVCPTPPDLDYSLGYYSSGSQGKTDFVQFTYTNPGPNTITDLAGEFDVEAPWTRNALGTRTGGFIKGLRWQTTVSGTPSGFTTPGAPLTVNDSTATPATTWYDDATMDGLGNLSIRDVPFSISGLALAPGDSITLRWDGSDGGSNHKNILAAIDNFVLNDTTGGGLTELYSQDFDAAGQAALASVGPGGPPDTLGFAPPAGWEVWANTANVPQLHVSDGTSTVWGGVYTGYYATAAASLPPCIEPTTDTPLFCTDETTTVQIDLNNVTDLYGYQFEVSYDDSLASASGAFVDSFFDTASDAFVGPGWDGTCTAGTCKFSVSKVAPATAVTGSGPVAEITFTGVSAGIFDVTIDNVILSDIDANVLPGVVVGGPLELTVCGFAKVQGTVSLQGRAAPPAGTTPPTAGLVELADAGFGPYSGAFDATGAYLIDNIKVMPGGTDYTIDATHPLYLDNQIIQTLNPGDDITLNTKLWGGDANNDGTIDISDLACIGGAFGLAPTVCGTTGSSDITADGAVNILDLVLPGGNFGKVAPQPW